MMLRNFFLWLVFTFSLTVNLSPTALAQAIPPWQAANEIRQTILAAQKEMFAAAQAADPAANYQAAATFIDEATARYAETLQPDLAAVGPEADQAITQALAAAHEAAGSGDGPALAAARGRVWTHLLWGSYETTLTALRQGEAGPAATWLQLREYRQATRVTVIEDVSTRAITALEVGEIEPAEALTIARLAARKLAIDGTVRPVPDG